MKIVLVYPPCAERKLKGYPLGIAYLSASLKRLYDVNIFIKSTHGPQASILYILPGTQLYRELVNKGRFNESLWVKSDAVYYYTQEQNIKTLNTWRKKVNHSGIKIPFSTPYFWDCVSPDGDDRESKVSKKFYKLGKKIKRYFNLMRNRY